MSKIVAIDYGEKRIGLALTDDTKTIAFPHKVVQADKSPEKSAKRVASELKKEPFSIEKIIIGLPLLLSGLEGPMAKQVKEFGEALESEINIKVDYMDERLSSKGADVLMRDTKATRKKRTKNLDSMSAVVLLQTYLNKSF